MSNTINVNYMTRAYNQYQQKNAAKDQEKEFKQQMNNWIHDLVSTISTRGWNNVPDMTLSIIYGKSSLKDMNQLITYQYEADRMNRQWYSVL